MGKNFPFAMPSNPFMLRGGTVLRLVDHHEKVVGSVVLEKDTDITFGFSQKNSEGRMLNYKTVVCLLEKGVYCVREEFSSAK